MAEQKRPALVGLQQVGQGHLPRFQGGHQLLQFLQTSLVAVGQGLRVNAGHGLNFDNVAPIAALEGIAELNIGHALVAQAVFDGWDQTIRNMKAAMIQARLQAQRGALLAPRHV